MKETVLNKYALRNKLAGTGGLVLFGCGSDVDIPVGELRQAFEINTKVYNRSFRELSLKESLHTYKEVCLPLAPATVLLHLGETDVDFFAENPDLFDTCYRELIDFIKGTNKKCRIAVVSQKNYDHNPKIEEMNRHLKYIADAEQCEFGNIADRLVWNPKATMDTSAFVYSTGFVRPLKTQRPLFNLVKIFFCCEC